MVIQLTLAGTKSTPAWLTASAFSLLEQYAMPAALVVAPIFGEQRPGKKKIASTHCALSLIHI